jgi:ELWxxDGT repeat protein
VEALESRRLLAAVPLGNLALTEGPAYTGGGPTVAVMNGAAYFTVPRSPVTTELWRSNGRAGGAVMVKSFQAYAWSNANDAPVGNLTVVGQTLYFTVNAGGPTQLWKSDGSAAGTTQVALLTVVSAPPSLTNVGGTLFFVDRGSIPVLWKSDGTAAGTKQVMGGVSATPYLLVDGQTLYFAASDGLYKTTPSGGTPVKITSTVPLNGRSLAVMDGALYFVGPGNFTKLYRYDGTSAPAALTTMVGLGSPELTVVGKHLYFAGEATTLDTELWQSDGTAAGTHLLKDINPGGRSIPADLVAMNGVLYFTADDGVHGRELWRSDGTESGTVLVTDLLTGSKGSRPDDLTVVDDRLYFGAHAADSGYELWRTDGTETGTELVNDVYRGSGGSRVRELVADGATVYFQAVSSLTGYGLFSANTATPGVTLLCDYGGGLMDGTTSLAGTSGGQVVFASGDGSLIGRELYVSDGTPGGIQLLKDIYGTAPFADSSPASLTNVNGTVFFSASSPAGNELWKTDGTAAGTVLVKDGGSYAGQSTSPTLLTGVGGHVFYGGYDETYPRTPVLWESDGTPEGTAEVSHAGGYTILNYPTVKDGVLYFLNGGLSLDSAVPGRYSTSMVRSLGQEVRSLALAGGTLYMSAPGQYATMGAELWKSDGTYGGTVMVKDINPNTDPARGATGSSPSGFTELNGLVYFQATDLTHGFELWRTDGTAAGTQLVKDIRAGTSSSSPGRFVKLGKQLVFIADDGTHGFELWKTDGTSAGTVLLGDLNPGAGASLPGDLKVIGDRVYFTANDGGGRRLWMTDGTTAGTRALTLPGSNPMNLTVVGGTLYFTANDGVNGPALYKWDDSATAPTVTAARFVADGVAPAIEVDVTSSAAGTLIVSALRLTNLTTGQSVDPGIFQVSSTPAGDRAILTVPNNAAGVLADGNYRLTIPAGSLRDAQGVALAGDLSFDFFVFAGDANHDRTVDFTDLVALAQNYNTDGKTFAQGDFNYDGNVDFNDLVILAQRYNTTLAAPGAAAVPAGSSFSSDWALVTSLVQAPTPSAGPAKRKTRERPLFSTESLAKYGVRTKQPRPVARSKKN